MTAGRASRRFAQTGSATLVSVSLAVVAGVALLIGTVVVSYVLALHEARNACDLAALAAAVQAAQFVDDERSCQEAGRIAKENGAELRSCEVVRAGEHVAARVEAGVPLAWEVPGLPREVAALSYAGNPDE